MVYPLAPTAGSLPGDIPSYPPSTHQVPTVTRAPATIPYGNLVPSTEPYHNLMSGTVLPTVTLSLVSYLP